MFPVRVIIPNNGVGEGKLTEFNEGRNTAASVMCRVLCNRAIRDCYQSPGRNNVNSAASLCCCILRDDAPRNVSISCWTAINSTTVFGSVLFDDTILDLHTGCFAAFNATACVLLNAAIGNGCAACENSARDATSTVLKHCAIFYDRGA